MRKELTFLASPKQGRVSALLEIPQDASAALVLAHGAGTDMRHEFMEALCSKLAEEKIASFRYNFPYTEKGKAGPNSAKILKQTVYEALRTAKVEMPELALFAGGKSMGGRMTSLAASERELPNVQGLLFFGFPLHPAGKPGVERAEHLAGIGLPMLFLQGPRDTLAKPEVIGPVIKKLGERATLHIVNEADHSFKVLKRSERKAEDAIEELALVSSSWMIEKSK